MTSVTAGLAWAVPVRPDLLGKHLQAFREVLPTLRTLRLCHRFGKGPKVHISRIPVELEQHIETIIVHGQLSDPWSPWEDYFLHFERRCDPVRHLDERYHSDFMDGIYEELHEVICDSCQNHGLKAVAACESECRDVVNDYILNGPDDFDEWESTFCETECDNWERLISQEKDRHFLEYDKALRKHFGLEAYFATTRAPEGVNTWPDHPNYRWHEKQPQTTVCYLTLPKQMTSETEWETTQADYDGGMINIQGSQACFVDLPALSDRVERIKQFQQALRTLHLEPYVHESQLNESVSPTAPGRAARKGRSKKKGCAVKDSTSKAKNLTKTEWPQLVMLVKTKFSFE